MEKTAKIYIVICNCAATGETWALDKSYPTYDAAVEAAVEDMAERDGKFGEDARAEAKRLLEKEGRAEPDIYSYDNCSYQIESVDAPPAAEQEPEPDRSFPVASISRDDIEMSGYEPDALTDSLIEEIASKMGGAYVQTQYWPDLEYWLGECGVPKLK